MRRLRSTEVSGIGQGYCSGERRPWDLIPHLSTLLLPVCEFPCLPLHVGAPSFLILASVVLACRGHPVHTC